MDIRWYGQSAFLLTGEQTVFVDPFGDPASMAGSGIEFRYSPIESVNADVVLVTHEHFDHNAVDTIGGEPAVLRAPGTHESSIGEIVGIASEHDSVAGTQRGPNTIFRFTFDGLSVAHFGDFGQNALRSEQRSALGEVGVLFLPVGGGPTIGGRGRGGRARAPPAARRADALPHGGGELPRAARRLSSGARRTGHAPCHQRRPRGSTAWHEQRAGGRAPRVAGLALAADAVAVSVEAVRIRVGDVPAYGEVAEGDVAAVEIRWRWRDADRRVRRRALPT
jgi:hypothetical protein